MIDCSAYLDAKLAHTSQAMMLCSAALLNAAMIRMPLLAEHKLGWLARPPRPSKVLLFFSLAPAIRADASCSRLYESHGCKSSHPELFGSASQALSDAPEPRIRGYRSLKLCIAAFSTNISSAAFFDGLKTSPWLRNSTSAPQPAGSAHASNSSSKLHRIGRNYGLDR